MLFDELGGNFAPAENQLSFSQEPSDLIMITDDQEEYLIAFQRKEDPVFQRRPNFPNLPSHLF